LTELRREEEVPVIPLVFDTCGMKTPSVRRNAYLILGNLHLVKPLSFTEHQYEGISESTWT
jgi:hypothetical protein